MNQMINEINERLLSILSSLKDGLVKDAMIYSVNAGGKRIRPIIFLQCLKAMGIDYRDYIDIACSIEMIHTYSLIHDDLPGMDNDSLRRGKPTCHIQFDEATAILAGDALLNEAMNVILNCPIDDSLKVKILKEVFNASSLNGMIYGQQEDMYFENKQASLKELENIHHYKTGCLIATSFKCAGIITNQYIDELEQLGFKLGLLFQIQDDILDVTSDEETLGKPVGSDEENHKSTYVSLLGIDKSNQYIETLFNECLQIVYKTTLNHGLLIEIIEKVMKRVN